MNIFAGVWRIFLIIFNFVLSFIFGPKGMYTKIKRELMENRELGDD